MTARVKRTPFKKILDCLIGGSLHWLSSLIKCLPEKRAKHSPPSLASTRLDEFIASPTLDLTPTDADVLVVADFVQLSSINPPPNAVEPSAPTLSRTALVNALLDEAWGQGLTTYPQLMSYVEQHSGTSCSRRAIANWKKARKLMEEAA